MNVNVSSESRSAKLQRPKRDRRLLLRAGASLLLIGAAAGVMVWLAISSLDSDPQPASATAAATANAVETPAANSLVAPMRPQSAIALPTVAVPATAEQLKQEAIDTAGELRARYPNFAEALHVDAVLHAQLRQTAEAEKLWRRCIELAPNHTPYYVNLATIAIDRGNSELAVETLQPLVDGGNASPDVLHHYGVALNNLGRCAEAEQAVSQVLAAHPGSASHWIVMGQAQLKQGKAAEAEQSLRKALDLGAQTARVYFSLANACARQKKQELAAEYRQRFSELSADEPLQAQERFQILTEAESRRTAVTILTEAAIVHRMQRDTLETERLLLRAIALDPASSPSCHALAALYHEEGLLPEEREVRKRLVEIEPHRFESYLNLAKVSAQLGETERAEAALKLAIAIHPSEAVGYASLAEFYLEQSRAEKARWFAQEALRRAPQAAGYRLLADACRRMGDAASADAALAKARELEHRPTTPSQNQADPP